MKIVTTVAAACALLVPSAQAQQAKDAAMRKADIVDTAVAAGSFNTLVAAVKAAGLVETLKGDGPFTVFAPTDDAFAKLPKGTVASLLKPENKDQLVSILTYHVAGGNFPAAKVGTVSSVKTVQGADLAISTKGGVKVGNANVVKADVMASNGVIHVIDSVLMPPKPMNLVETAASAGKFSTLIAAAKAAGLAGALSGDQPLTVFAPTDAAFAKLPKGTVESLLKPENKAKLQAILKYHVVAGSVDARTAVTAATAKTLQGGDVAIEIVEGRLTVNGAKVIANDVRASNGVIHVIDSVILPKN